MLIYYFDLANHHYDPDVEGTEPANADTTRKQGVIFAASICAITRGWRGTAS